MSGRRCDTCEWFRPLPHHCQLGSCHRYPTQGIIKYKQPKEHAPVVEIDDWCGEWKAKEEQKGGEQ